MTPDQEARANDAANAILKELGAAKTPQECQAVSQKHEKVFARLQQVHPARALHIINLASLMKSDFQRAERQKNKQQAEMFR